MTNVAWAMDPQYGIQKCHKLLLHVASVTWIMGLQCGKCDMNHKSTMWQVWHESWVYNVAGVTWIMGLQCGRCDMNHGSTMRQVWRESWVYNVASVTWIMGLQCGKCHTNTGPSWGKCHTGWQCDKSKMSHWLIMWQMLQEMWGQNMAEVSVMYSNVSNIFILQMAGFHPRGSLCAEQWLNGAYFLAAANKTASALTSCCHAVTRQQVPSHPVPML